MKVSFNPAYSYKTQSFGKNENIADVKKTYTDKEIKVAKTKKAISECATIAVGVGILYFAMKNNFKINKIKNHEKKLRELANLEEPTIRIANLANDNFIRV